MKFESVDRKRYVPVLGFFVLCYGIFAASGEPAFGDDLSFTLAAMKGFDWATNATNHFLYINSMHALYAFFEQLGGAGRLPFLAFSLVPGILVLSCLFRIFKELGVSFIVSALAVMAFGFSFTFWRHNEIVEVYTLNLAINAQVILWFVRWNKDRKQSYLIKAAVLLGVGMLVHVQNVLLLPFLAFWSYQQSTWKIQEHIKPVLAFLIPASILIIIPLATGSNTLSSILFDNSFQDEVLGFQLMVLVKGFGKAIAYLVFNFGFFAILLTLAPFKKILDKTLTLGLVAIAVPVFVFAARYNVSDNYVFFLPSYLALMVLAGPYLQELLKERKKVVPVALCCVLLVPGLYAALPYLALKTPQGQELQAQKWYKGGVYFFLWPGMNKNPGAKELIRSIDSGLLDPNENLEVEQNVQNAREYLQLMEQQVH